MKKKQKTFECLFDRHFHSIYKFAYGITGCAETAEDLTQETFLKLYHSLDSFMPILNPRAWLFRVVSNHCLNYLKREKKFREIQKEFPEETGRQDTSLSRNPMEDDYIKKQETELIRIQIERLPERDRIIIMLYQEGFSYKEMAKIMNIKLSSIGVIISRAIDKLEKNIKNTPVHHRLENKIGDLK